MLIKPLECIPRDFMPCSFTGVSRDFMSCSFTDIPRDFMPRELIPLDTFEDLQSLFTFRQYEHRQLGVDITLA